MRNHARAFIRQNLRLEPAPRLPEIRLYRAHPESGLRRLAGEDGPPPYWAYGWAGGTILARYILDHPETVAGRVVHDIGCGSGVAAIAAALAGAASVTASDSDPHALAAARLNAEVNGATIAVAAGGLSRLPDADLILGGDVFYSEEVAIRMTAVFDLCLAAGKQVLVGDPYRAFLPLGRLCRIAQGYVPDFGQGEPVRAGVFAFMAGQGSRTPGPQNHEGVDL